ncbi:MAG: DUF2141 domain-containing protein [Rhodomicrobium sp.]
MRLSLLALCAAACAVAGISFEAKAQSSDLTVEVSGLRNYKGHAVLMLWPDSGESSKFPDASKVQYRDERAGDQPCDFPNAAICRRVIESLQNLTVSYTFKSLPPGDYSVFVFHDENNNGILDTGLMRRPLEARGYSGVLPEDVSPVTSKIKFDQARFTLSGPKTITVGLRYPPRF